MMWIPDISKVQLDVQLRDNGKFNYHDFTLWPQFYFPQTCHFAFVRCRPSDMDLVSHPYALLWYSMDERHDLVREQGSLVPQFGKISPSLLERIMEVCHRITEDICAFLPTITPDTRQFKKFILKNGIRAMQLTSVSLSVGAQRYPAVLATFNLFQCQALEALACLEMLTIWQDKVQTARDNTIIGNTDRSVMGAITHSLHIAVEMASLGVPIWLVQPPQLVPHDIKIYNDAWPPTMDARILHQPGH